jgi:hypothetical protein
MRPVMSEATKDKRGMGMNGKPRILDREIPDIGVSSSVPGTEPGSYKICLSQGEKYFYLMLWWNDDVDTIETQVVLNKEDTNAIAEKLGCRKFNNGRTAMTTDFLVTMKDKTRVAYSLKASRKDIENERTKKKLEMEFLYWKARNIECHLVFKEDFDPVFCANLADVYAAYDDRFLCDDIGLVRHLIAHKKIQVDMSKPLDYQVLLQEKGD